MDFSSAHPRSSSSLVFVLNRKKSNDKNAVISQCSLKQLDHENWALGVWVYVVYTGEEAAGTRFGFVSPDWSADGSAVTALAAKLPLTLRPLL